MCRRWFIALLAMSISVWGTAAKTAYGQQAGQQNAPAADSADAKPQPAKVGSYSLVVTTLEPSPTAHWLNPPPTINVTGGTKLAPAETAGDVTVPAQYLIESFGTPRRECVETAPPQHACDALDETNLTIRDPHTVGYRIVTHGGAVQLRLNLQVHDLLPVSHGGANTDWHAGEVIFVSVPKPTPLYRFVSETLAGQWNGNAIVFEPGKPLPAAAKKGLDDLGVDQDLGDAVLYSYRVKDPAAKGGAASKK